MDVVFLALQILLTIAVGTVGKKLNIMDESLTKKLSPFLMDIGVPALVIYTFAGLEFDASSFKAGIMLIAVCLFEVVLLFALGKVLCLAVKDRSKKAISNYAAIFGNATFFGIPIVQGLYGAEGMFYYLMFNLPIRALYYICIPVILAPHDNGLDKKEVLGVLKSPPVVALYISLVIYVTGFQVPEVIMKPLGNISTLVSTMGIILIGVSVAEFSVKDVFSNFKNLILPIEKVIIAPCVVLVLFKLLFSFILPPLGIAVCVIYAGLPLATLTTVFATKYYGDDVVRWISLQTVISTLMSVVTIPVIALAIEAVLL